MGPEVHRQTRRLSSPSSNKAGHSAARQFLRCGSARVCIACLMCSPSISSKIASTAGAVSRVERYCCTGSHCSGSGMAVPRRANALRCMHRHTPANTQSRQDRKITIPGIVRSPTSGRPDQRALAGALDEDMRQCRRACEPRSLPLVRSSGRQ